MGKHKQSREDRIQLGREKRRFMNARNRRKQKIERKRERQILLSIRIKETPLQVQPGLRAYNEELEMIRQRREMLRR